jgi:hypothetical protein
MKTKARRKLKTIAPGMCVKIHGLCDNGEEASMLLKEKEIVETSSAGVIWNGISFEKMVIPGVAHTSRRFFRDACDAGPPHPRRSGPPPSYPRPPRRVCDPSERAEEFERPRPVTIGNRRWPVREKAGEPIRRNPLPGLIHPIGRSPGDRITRWRRHSITRFPLRP